MVTVQVPVVPVQAPLQPLKPLPGNGVAVKVTLVPPENAAPQVMPQLMPAGLLVTEPVPVPDLLTVSTEGPSRKLAVTLLAALIVTTQLTFPLQAPLQPLKPLPAEGTAMSVTLVPMA
jgi:hypothetical protein